MDEDLVSNYTTYETQFSATLLQTDPFILSDTFDIKIDFAWISNEIAQGNASFLKMKYFIEDIMHQCVFTHKASPIDMKHIKNKIVVFPFVPTNDIIAMCLHSKLNAICHEHMEILSITIGSKYANPKMSYTYNDPDYPMLPTLKEWIGQSKYYYDAPWWGRNTIETQDYEVDENTDLTSPPKFDTILEQIEKLTVGELDLKPEGTGEVVDINGWKPKIVKD
ncbi:MAG: hypothetical protein CBB97_02425 [Candidatus Endolissoclinum sp. TMED37]|nr:MAG: hypothetical protein CBB97_02425 [Candidatus Endolissoclinum sp. TMED37]